MAQWLCCIRLSPACYILHPETTAIQIPWCVTGSMILSLLSAHVQAAVLHKGLDARTRLETAMTGIWIDQSLFAGKNVYYCFSKILSDFFYLYQYILYIYNIYIYIFCLSSCHPFCTVTLRARPCARWLPRCLKSSPSASAKSHPNRPGR